MIQPVCHHSAYTCRWPSIVMFESANDLQTFLDIATDWFANLHNRPRGHENYANWYPLVMTNSLLLKRAIYGEAVPSKIVIFHNFLYV